ncbi:MAG TPA: flagellar filament capping protein FliD [Stenomitos sp.]
MGGPIQLGGLASGLDTSSLINQLMAIEQQPLNLINQKKQTLFNKNSAFQAINTRISALQSAAGDLTLDLNLRAKSATPSNTSILTAKAGASAAAGTYQIRVDRLATASSVTTSAPIGAAVTSTNTALSALNLSSPLKDGTFTLQYTVGGTVKNASINVAGTDDLNAVFTRIAAATGGSVTASLVNNKIELAGSNASNIVAGASTDTSNFLSITNLKGAAYSTPGAALGVLRSNYGIGVAQVGVGIDTTPGPSLNGATINSTTSGEFKINGVSITYNTSTDSINNILGKINNSSAGVSASYNGVDDKIVLTSRTTGSGAISLQDVTGNFLQAVGLNDPARQQVTDGQNALIGIVGVNGFTSATGAADFSKDVSSATNTFTNILPGLTLTAMKEDPGLQSLTVAADNSAITDKVKAFIAQYNQTVDAITSATDKDQPNAFDSDLRMIQDRMRSMVNGTVAGLPSTMRSLIDIGISTTKADRVHLTLDETKFKAALEANPDGVAQIFQLTQPDPADSTKTKPLGIAAVIKDYLFNVGSTNGVFKTRDASTQKQQRAYDQQIQDLTTRMDQTRATMVKQFAAMEQAVSKLHSQQSAFLSQLSSLG